MRSYQGSANCCKRVFGKGIHTVDPYDVHGDVWNLDTYAKEAVPVQLFLPVGIQGQTVLHLHLIAAGLGVLIRGDPAIGTDPEFFLLRFGLQVSLSRDYLDFTLGTVCIGVPDSILRRLPLLFATTSRTKWGFLGYFRICHLLTAAECD